MDDLLRTNVEVQRLSDGLLRLEADESGIYLVHRDKPDRVRLTPAMDEHGKASDGRFRGVTELSDRERQVFALLGEGLDMASIGERLGLSVKTIETYRARIKQKLDIRERTQLLALAVEWNLTGRPGTNGPPTTSATH